MVVVRGHPELETPLEYIINNILELLDNIFVCKNNCNNSLAALRVRSLIKKRSNKDLYD